MDALPWIQRSRQLGQAVKNAQRLRHILTIFAKHGFVDVVNRMHLGRFLPRRLKAGTQAEHTAPERLRKAFEELGPTFVKLGQVLASRSDLLPAAYVNEFTKLQDTVQPVPFEAIRGALESELKRGVEEAFAEFNPVPIAAASIGQVHEAKLKDGTEVVVKIQRPDIRKTIETDISLLSFMAGLLEKYVPETRFLSPRVIVDEFFRTLSQEMDYVIEASNMSKIAKNLEEFPEIVIPRVYKEYSTRRVLTQGRLRGIRVHDLKALDAAGIDRKQIVRIGAQGFFKALMRDGLFHGDLHAGNLFVLEGGRLGVIDFGMVGRISRRSRDQLAQMVLALMSEDFESLCYQYAELGSAGASIDFERFQREVRNTLSPYLGLSISEINMGKVLIEATQIASRYRVQVPGDWMLVFKAIYTMEGMGRLLDPEFDFMAMGQELVGDLLKDQYSPKRLSQELALSAKDGVALLQVLPRQLRWMFRKFNRNDFALEVKSAELERLQREVEQGSRRLSLSILGAGLFIAAALALHSQVPASLAEWSPVFWAFGIPGAVILALVFLKLR